MSGRNGKRIRATFRERPVVLLGPPSVPRRNIAGRTPSPPAPKSSPGSPTARCRASRPWVTKFNGTISDDRWVDPVVESFNLHAHLEPLLETMAPTAEIAILDPATTLRHHGQETREEAEANDLGFYHALVEAKLPFEMLSDLAMTPLSLDRFKVIILANSTCLSDAQCQTLRDYVGRGGSIVAAFETATRDAENAPRNTLALGDLFGVTDDRPHPRSAQKHLRRAQRQPPDCRRLRGRQADHRRYPRGSPSSRPPQPPLPSSTSRITPICRWRRFILAKRHAIPRGSSREHAGRRPDCLYSLEHRRHLLGGAGRRSWPADRQRRALGTCLVRPHVEVTGRAVVDIAVRENKDRLSVALVNLTNPMMMKGPTREIYPCGPA